ncbi:MAG: hypothetical protein N2510_01130 [Ignavibacteria bacterium]|nr:hypothetical protein [Ignavibacteria bacterium]
MQNLNKTLILISAVFLISACTKKQEQKTDEKKDGQQQVQDNNQQTSAGEIKTNELGIKEGKPGDYPSDIPEPINSKVLGSLNTSEGTVVTYESTSKPKPIFEEFRNAVEKAGFKKVEAETITDDGGMAAWKMDKREVSIMLAWDKDKNISSVVVTYR